MRSLHVAALAALAVAVAAAGCSPTASDAASSAIGQRRFAVAFGELDTGHPSVGLVGLGGGSCTGTLIGRRTVLTAGHCVPDANKVPSFTLTANGNEEYDGESAAVHPQFNLNVPNFSDYDVAIIRLKRKVSGVKPSQLTYTAPKVNMIVTMVGYGIPGDSGLPGAKRTGKARVSQVSPLTFVHQHSGTEPTTCSGDSGGPVFYDEGGAEKVMGVHSGGTVPCDSSFGYGIHTRVDSHRTFIEQEAGADLYTGGPIDVTPPTVSIKSPKDGERPDTQFTLEVDAHDDDSGVVRVELWIDGDKKDEVTAAPYTFDVSGLERRCYDIEVRAVDAEDNVGKATRQICVSDGDPFGTSCTSGDSCAGGLCLDGACSQACTSLKPCPDGFDCQNNQCVAPPDAGGCAAGGAGAGTGAGAGALLALLALLLLAVSAARSRPRRRRLRARCRRR